MARQRRQAPVNTPQHASDTPRPVLVPKKPPIPRLPALLGRKIYKTGQTRGADDDEIFQNRVGRNNTVLIPYLHWDQASMPPEGEKEFENGFIALVPPLHYFSSADIAAEMAARGLALGKNAVVFYETRAAWIANNPDALGWQPAQNRRDPLGGEYVARIPATTATAAGAKIIRGFETTKPKGAGIRLYEYASLATMRQCRLQLEALYWLCGDSVEVTQLFGMTAEQVDTRMKVIIQECEAVELLDLKRLAEARIINTEGRTICPLCLEELSAKGLFSKVEQAEGRQVHDLTITQLNLFHINELRYGVYNHRPYNLAWGHHHCNVVAKDSGVIETLIWMDRVVQRNIENGHFIPSRISQAESPPPTS
jgi:hypothetical protein